MSETQEITQENEIITETEKKEFVIPDIITEDIGFELMFGFSPKECR